MKTQYFFLPLADSTEHRSTPLESTAFTGTRRLTRAIPNGPFVVVLVCPTKTCFGANATAGIPFALSLNDLEGYSMFEIISVECS